MKKILLLLLVLPSKSFAAEYGDTNLYRIIASSESCPSEFKELGTIEDSCPSGTVQYGEITGYTQYGADEKGAYSCSI
jgi:hypothetical protein